MEWHWIALMIVGGIILIVILLRLGAGTDEIVDIFDAIGDLFDNKD